MNQYKHYATIANLFEYPDALFIERVTSVQTRIREAYGEAMEPLDDFIALLPRNDLCMLQE
jgi:nitrate reductase assembly molybdenum cofactor insertion protein NarJ